MKQKVVGIVPYAPDFGKNESRYEDKYHFTDTYEVRAYEAGLLPIGVLPVEGRIRTDILDLCDCFIIQGGSNISPYHLEVIEHALRTGKKVLGICLGCQAIQCYFATKAEIERKGLTGSVADLYDRIRKEAENPFLVAVSGHRPTEVLPRDNAESLKHPVHLTEGSNIARILGKTEIRGCTFHFYAIGEPAPGLTVTGRAPDGVIEAIEYGDKVIGTQFHPDVDQELHELFDWLGE